MADDFPFPPDLLDSLGPRAFTVARTDHGFDFFEHGEHAVQVDVAKPVFHKENYIERRLHGLGTDEVRAIRDLLGRVLDDTLG